MDTNAERNEDRSGCAQNKCSNNNMRFGYTFHLFIAAARMKNGEATENIKRNINSNEKHFHLVESEKNDGNA